jgi:hypothetical protein
VYPAPFEVGRQPATLSCGACTHSQDSTTLAQLVLKRVRMDNPTEQERVEKDNEKKLELLAKYTNGLVAYAKDKGIKVSGNKDEVEKALLVQSYGELAAGLSGYQPMKVYVTE